MNILRANLKVLLPALALVAGAAHGAGDVDFSRDVKPILERHCVSCHQPDKDKGGLMLHTREGMLEGGDYGAAVVPGKPDESELMMRVALPHDDVDVMPPKGEQLSAEQQEVLRAWIRAGAPVPDGMVLREVTEEELRRIAEVERKSSRVRELLVFPDEVQLQTRRDFQRIVAMAVLDDDTTLDVSGFVDLRVAHGDVVRIDGTTLHPSADGATSLEVSFAGHRSTVDVEVTEAKRDRPVSFHQDVMPVFMRETCNSGGCHGAARGQDRFMLSLFGYDPDGDHHRITREMAGRRINLAMPGRSLLIEKALQRVPHSGGKLFEEDSHAHATLLEWIENGAVNDSGQKIAVSRLELMPGLIVLDGEGSTQELVVRAHYEDGSVRDVTHLVLANSTNEGVATVGEDGVVTGVGRGETFVLARYEAHSVTSQVLVIPPGSDVSWDDSTYVRNELDQLVNAKLRRLRIRPSELCTDEEFIRRLYIDLAGRLPTPEETRRFVSDPARDKRSQWIGRLLEQPTFSDVWVMKWADLLQIRSDPNERRYADGVARYHRWLKGQVESNRPIDAMVRDLLVAEGTTHDEPATMFYEMERDTLLLAENTAQVFLGMRLQCAQCHNHPFDRWTMDDYYGFAAFFAQVGRKETDDPAKRVVFDRGGGRVTHFLTKQDVPPRFLGGGEPDIERGTDRREVLADWLASADNRHFARNIANLVWQHHLGVGIVNPIDDVRISNPPSNPELLDELADRLVRYEFDLRSLVRDVVNSHTYQRATRANETNRLDERNFSKGMIRRMRAEVLLDSLAQITETPAGLPGVRPEVKAVQLADARVNDFFLSTFGRSSRETVCSCEVEVEPNLSQALHLLNGNAVHGRIVRGRIVRRLLDDGLTIDQVIDNLYLRCFSREPTDRERREITDVLDRAGDGAGRVEVLEDLLWALLNSKEFLFNH